MSQEIREDVLKLMQQKDKIESEIQELTSILTKNGVGMSDPLVDTEGFPLNNIDIYQVRHARHQIICLQNDHKAIMKQIEQGLHGYYSSAQNGTPSREVEQGQHNVAAIEQHRTPFAKVTTVSDGSPADIAGLQVDDFVVEFGSINSTNFTNITDIANVVRHSEGHQLRIKLKRGDRFIVTQLLPKLWAGQGLLGCTIVRI
ncbi:26S proteasome non-ATPase regulatory subunit 9 [Onthophagus taurus]|uniref:26S proteasome non-ATPase regulatory subunit 9 n=1 Tax=Onthophagus taurus TaxID=166361 RepID=UPI000C2003C4|nr:26S proteasome non-ATPase regulatory subunit 9 [Onthophagus taurus]